jgi:hypothetical protein
MNYYYYRIDDEIKGPLSTKEMLDLDLSNETLVKKMYETEWKRLLDFEELCKIEGNIKINKTNNQAKVIRIPKRKMIFLIYPLGILIALIITYFQKINDLENFQKRIDTILNGNNSVCDYVKSGEKGELLDAYMDEVKLFGLHTGNSELRTDKFSLAEKPKGDEDINNPQWGDYYKSKIKKWNRLKDVKQYFESDMFSGFDMVVLKKNEESYSVVNLWSGDMAYLVPERNYYKGYQDEYFSSPGYSLPTGRPGIEMCYEKAAEFIIKDGGHVRVDDSYSKINAIPFMTSKFYKLDQGSFQSRRLADSIFIKYEKDGQYNKAINQDPITKRTNLGDASIFNSQWIVWYKEIDNSYFIAPVKYSFLKYSIINSLVVTFFMVLINLIIVYRKKVVFE